MITLQELLVKDPVCLGIFEEVKDIEREFECSLGEYRVIFACYRYEDYEGFAYVLLADQQNNLWEVQGSHCSCYGRESQFNPVYLGKDPMTALKLVLKNDTYSEWVPYLSEFLEYKGDN